MSSTTAHAQSTKFYISKTKVVKPRDGEEEDTITIWDEKLKSTTGSYRWRAFGIKGRENLENLYFGVLSMLQKNYKSIAKESKFAPKSLNNLLSSLNDEDKECLKTNIQLQMTRKNHSQWKNWSSVLKLLTISPA